MSCSNGSVHLIKPNEQLTVEAGGPRARILRLLRLTGNYSQEHLTAQIAFNGGIPPMNGRRLDLEASKALAYENFRRIQIR